MPAAPLPPDENERLAALRRLGILDTPPEQRYDRLVRLAAASLGTPIALISIVDEERQWFKARVGLDATETSRDVAFCSHAIVADAGPFVVDDATTDVRFALNPLVTGKPNIVFYAGEVVHDPDGHAMGTICVIDHVTHEFTEAQRRILRDLADLVEYEFAAAERDRAVAALDKSERSKSVLLDSLSEGMVVQDADGRIVEWNAVANRLLGLSDEQLSGRTSFDPRWRTVHVDGSPWPGDQHPAIESIRTGEPVAGPTMGVHRPDGSLVWLRVNSRPIKDRVGRTTGSITLFGDIAAEFDAVKASETMALRLRQAVESSGIGTALLDGTGSTTFVNKAYADIVGLGHDRLLGHPLSAWIHPDDPMFHTATYSARGDRPAGLTTEIRVAPRDDAATWVRAHIARLTDTGDDDHYIIQLEDVTERRTLQEALRRSERIARAALDSLEQGVIVADDTGVVHQSNRSATHILGFSADELTVQFRSGQWTTYDEHGAILPMQDRPIPRALASGEPVRGALVGWRRCQGDLVLLRVSCVPVASDGTGPTRFVVAFADVTEQHRSARLLDATLATAPVGLAVVDADHAVVRCNPTFAAQVGAPVEAVIGCDIAAVLGHDRRDSDTDDADDDDRGIAGGIAGGMAGWRANDERLITRRDGTQVWVDTRTARIDDLHQPLDIVATFDVTVRKRLELDLQRFGHLFEHANDIITVVDETGHVRYASPSNERVFGYPDGWRSAGGVLELVHPDDLAVAAARFVELREGARGDEPLTVRIRTHDGSWRHIETVGTNLLHEPSVNGIVLTSRDVTERQLLTVELAHRATHDGLTDLPNRAAAQERLNSALARARRERRHVGLCFLDLDRFKSVNDSLGHAAGDTVLMEVATRLRSVVRESDLPARLGGDEFVVVLDLVPDEHDAMVAARRIHERLNVRAIVAGELTVSVSMGVAISRLDDSASALMSRADAALYRAKTLASGICSYDQVDQRAAVSGRDPRAPAAPRASSPAVR